MSSRANFYDIENLCQHYYNKYDEVYHLCTPENHPIIFHNSDEFKTGMSLLGLVASSHKDVKIITFELMNNHAHIITAGTIESITNLFNDYKKLLTKCLSHDGCAPDLDSFNMHLHRINSLENMRNAIAYVNRNGSVVDRHVCPYSYLWGANKYFFNPEAKSRYQEKKRKITTREKRNIAQSHKFDNSDRLYVLDGYICPLSFCAISDGENLFRDTRHYFSKISRHIESYDEIAKLIGEQIYYTDDDLFSVLCTLSQKHYNCKIPSQLKSEEKVAMAKLLHKEYNANVKQLQRMLKIDAAVLTALFG